MGDHQIKGFLIRNVRDCATFFYLKISEKPVAMRHHATKLKVGKNN